MKLALVHPDLSRRGGAENVVYWMARSLLARGHEASVHTLAFDPAAWPAEGWKGIPVELLPAPRRTRFLPRPTRRRWPGRHLARQLAEADLVVCHNYSATVWVAEAVRRRGTRAVWFCEEPPARLHWRRSLPRLGAVSARPERYPWLAKALRLNPTEDQLRRARRRQLKDVPLEREAVRRMDERLANSEFTARTASAIYGCSFHACLLGAPEPAEVHRETRGEPYVAWVTSAAPHKNALGFLEALRVAVHERGAHDLRVRVVGLDLPDFRARIAESELEKNVILEGRLDDARLSSLIASSRLVALPPIDEPFGLVAVEAMALGRAVLASSVGGPAETVVHAGTGLHADPLDPCALADRLLELWYTPERCEALGAAGRERYRRGFTFEHFMERFLAAALGPEAPEASAARPPSRAEGA